MSELDAVRADLSAERLALDALLAGLGDASWSAPTPSPGWDVADQVGHLAYFDESARLAIADPEAFAARVSDLLAGAAEAGVDGYTLAPFRAMAPRDLLAAWRANGAALDGAAAALTGSERVAWYGPPMSATSFLTARLMETWAHGHDVASGVGLDYPATARLRHVARLGFVTRAWSYAVRGEEPPATRVRLELTGPDAERWTWGDEDAVETISGPALDLCLVVTQRRHIDDTALVVGEAGRHWLERAQAFAGPPTQGPPPGGRRGAG